MENADDAEEAMRKLTGTQIDGRDIRVSVKQSTFPLTHLIIGSLYSLNHSRLIFTRVVVLTFLCIACDNLLCQLFY